MGFRAQFALYGYYILTAALLRATSPPLSLMTAQETALGGALRSAHQRLVVHAEEVAFNDPPGGLAERWILNQHLGRLLRHSRLSAFQQFVQQVTVWAADRWCSGGGRGAGGGVHSMQRFVCHVFSLSPTRAYVCVVLTLCACCPHIVLPHIVLLLFLPTKVFDGYFIKYFASTVALLMYGAPIYFKSPARRGSQGDMTQDYIRAMRLLQNTSRYVLLSRHTAFLVHPPCRGTYNPCSTHTLLPTHIPHSTTCIPPTCHTPQGHW